MFETCKSTYECEHDAWQHEEDHGDVSDQKHTHQEHHNERHPNVTEQLQVNHLNNYQLD